MVEVKEKPVKKRRKGCWITSGVFAAILVVAGLFFGPTLKDFYKRGLLDFILNPPKKHAYSASSEENLKALYTAMALYHESEGQYPDASGWMDGLKGYLEPNDLQKGEGQKKLIRPDFLGQDGKYGYAMNDAASAKYKEDIKAPKDTPLIYESKDTGRNAHGDPAKQREGLAISMTGEILKK